MCLSACLLLPCSRLLIVTSACTLAAQVPCSCKLQGATADCAMGWQPRLSPARSCPFPCADGSSPSLIVRNDGPFEREHPWRGAATAVPVFSLRSRRSVGCGEFADLTLLADFCKAAGDNHVLNKTCNGAAAHTAGRPLQVT